MKSHWYTWDWCRILLVFSSLYKEIVTVIITIQFLQFLVFIIYSRQIVTIVFHVGTPTHVCAEKSSFSASTSCGLTSGLGTVTFHQIDNSFWSRELGSHDRNPPGCLQLPAILFRWWNLWIWCDIMEPHDGLEMSAIDG